MAIDWITVSAQIVNFLILVGLLKHFLYQPIIRAMDRREQRVSERLNEAQERESQADEKARQYQDKSEEIDLERNAILEKAREDAEQQKKQMLDEAREKVDEKREHWQSQVNQEKEEFLDNLRRQAVEVIESIIRKALHDLADAELEDRMIHTFLERLKSLDKDTRKALSDTDEPVLIHSAFELDSTLRGRLTRAVHQYLAEDLDVDYNHAPDLLCGIELTSSGRRVSWNLADYTEELSRRIDEAFSPTEPAEEKEK